MKNGCVAFLLSERRRKTFGVKITHGIPVSENTVIGKTLILEATSG